MRSRLSFLLFLAAAGLAGPGGDGTLTNEEANFTIALPSIDWKFEEVGKDASRAYVKAHLSTEYADSDPPARADVQVWVVPLSKDFAAATPKMLAEKWKDNVEATLTNTRDLVEGEGTLGGAKCWSRSIKGEAMAGVGHVSWDLALMGKNAYVLYVSRTYQAVDDEDLAAEIAKVKASFKFLREEKVAADKDAPKQGGAAPGPAGAGGGAKVEVDPALLQREELEETHWRLKYVKPQGMLKADPLKFEEGDRNLGMIANLSASGEQTGLTIRVYAATEATQKYTLDQLLETRLKWFQDRYPDEKKRLPPEINKNYKKFPMVDEGYYAKLVGRRVQPETTCWYLLQCKNDRQYQVEIYLVGATAEQIYKQQIEDFLKGFKPQRK
jgi:hypothetical protein